MTIIVDTDALLALINPADSLHAEAKAILIELHARGAKLALLPTTLSEFALISANRVGLDQTKAVVEVWTRGLSHQVLVINQELTVSAIKLFRKQTSEEESLFDCFVMAASQKYNFDAIFSFDHGYLKQKNQDLKLKLVSSLFPDLNW
jgi:predicted nucleic acid-binding protein